MSNYPPPPPYGGQYYAVPKNPFPPPGNGNFAMNYQSQHIQQPVYQPPYPQGMAAGQAAQYANAAAFAQNQFHHAPQPHPPNPYAYAQYALPNSSQPYVHGQGQAAMASSYSHPIPGPGVAPAQVLQPTYPPQPSDQWASNSQWSYAHAPDATDAAIHRALAAASATQPAQTLPEENHLTQQASPEKQIAGHDGTVETAAAESDIQQLDKDRLLVPTKAQPLAALPGLTPPRTNASHSTPPQEGPSDSTQLRTDWQEKKGKAQAALLEMLKGGVTLEQLSREGFDVELLDELQAGSMPRRVEAKRANQIHPARSLESGEISEDDLYESEAPNGTAQATKPLIPTTIPQKTVAQLPPSSSPKKGEERKDYIARLLAAKQAVAKPTISSLDGTASARLEPAQMVGTHLGPPAQTKELSKRGETKDPVQTELVRQRLEALKASSRPAPIQTSTHPEAAPPEPRDHQESRHRYVPIQEAEPHSGGEPMYTPRSNSFYADGDQGFAGLPGLSPVLTKPGLPAEDQSRHPGTVADVLQNRAEHIDAAISPRPERAPIRVDYPPQPRLSSPVSAPNSQSRKRAMASDFIDSPPQTKRRMGPDGQIQLVIDVSDDEEGEITNSVRRENFPGGEASLRNIASERNVPGISTPKSLTDLEAEMKAMREKIAERQRNKRKAQEMMAASGLTAGSDSGFASPSAVLADAEEKSKQQQRALAASRTLLKEKLEAERKTHALITAQAETERRHAAEASTAIERDQRLDRKAVLETSIPKLDASIQATVQRMENIQRQQAEVQEELGRWQRERQAMIDELNKLLSSSEVVASTSARPGVPSPPDEDENVHSTKQHTDSDNMMPVEQPSSNQSSTDMPEYTRRRSESVSSQDNGENAMDEAMDMSRSSDDEEQLTGYDRSRTDSLYDNPPQDPRLGQLQAETSLPVSGATSRDEVHTDPQDEYELSLDERFSDDDDQEDLDSGAPVDVQEEYPESSADDQEEEEESEDYDSEQVPEPVVVGEPQASTAPASAQEKEGDGYASHLVEPDPVHPSHQGSEEGEITDDERSSSDGYEPPEAAATEDRGQGAGISQGGARDTGSLPRDSSEADGVAVVGAEQTETNEGSAEHRGHFQPYESPLTRFHSYRFHPQYVANVSGGFTSLTYSHRITNTPLCRWETTGGICNDSTCAYQHFRDLSLTGNALLLQLGSVYEGKSPDEVAQYKEGLRALLAAMSESGPKGDVAEIAAAIVAYRARFLDDTSRIVVLPRSKPAQAIVDD